MKKGVLIFAAVSISFTGMAQDKYVVSALTSLKQSNFDEAKEDIDRAMANPETKEKPKALYAKAQVYFAMQNVDKYKDAHPYREGTQALLKLNEVKGDYERANVDQLLVFGAFNYYNDGVKEFNNKNFSQSTELMANVVKIHDIGGGKRFDKYPKKAEFDEVAAEASLTMANSAYYAGKYQDAIPLLIAAKNNPATKKEAVYQCLIDAYTKLGKTNEAAATIDEARKAFPNDPTLRNFELNYYITNGKQEELVKKLEEAAAKEPGNADIAFNLATTYLGMSAAKDGKKPANAAEFTAKSEEAFNRVIKIEPQNAVYNYNFGALYFNQGTEINDQMNAITGSSAADLKKYDDLKKKRDAIFDKSLPYFEKSYEVLSKETNLQGEDLNTYKSTLMALREVYKMQNKLDKSNEMKKKLESM